MKALRRAICSVVILWISGCASTQHKELPLKQTLMQVYADSVGEGKKDTAQILEDNLTERKTYGYVKPYVPVIQEPVVRKVWIPDHKSTQET